MRNDSERFQLGQQPKPSRSDVCRLVGLALVCEKTAIKALTFGPEKVRGTAGERCAEAMRALGLRPLSEVAS